MRLWKKDAPIIGSLLEADTYKFTMLYFIFRFFPNLIVTFAFTNRNSNIRLAEHINIYRFREECQHVMSLVFSDIQIDKLKLWGLFPKNFLEALKTIKLPEPMITKTADGQFDVRVRGPWFHVTLWELYILPILSELYTRSIVGEDNAEHERFSMEGEKRLLAKIELFKKLHWQIALFGLRRRASGDWERRVTDILLHECPERISGCANVQMAIEFCIEAIGTSAHELAMALYALRRFESDIAAFNSQYEVLDKWQQLYGHQLLIMLPDTFGSDQFFKNLPRQYFSDWRGPRQDSGDPFYFGRNVIWLYKNNRINPVEKLILFTDGLNAVKMLDIENEFYGQIGGGFGLGTNASNDLGFPAVPMVMKLVEAAGNPAVKLSDNLAKAIGKRDEILKAKEIFRYSNTFTEDVVY